jgi:hypothetical protein
MPDAWIDIRGAGLCYALNVTIGCASASAFLVRRPDVQPLTEKAASSVAANICLPAVTG